MTPTMTPTMTHTSRPGRGLFSLFLASLVSLPACGDDGTTADTEGDTDGTSGTGTTMSSTPTTMPSTDPTTGSTTTDPTDATDSVTATEPTTETATSTGTGTDTDGGTGTDTAGFDCGAIPQAPFTATPVFETFTWEGSEDLAFDGAGQIVGLRDPAGPNNGELIAVDAMENETQVATGIPPLYGLRYRPTGELLGAAFMAGEIIEVDPGGNVSVFASNVGGVNGIYVDFDNVLWFTNFQDVVRVDDQGTTTIASGADGAGANGVIYDADRMMVFFTGYTSGTIRRVSVDADGQPTGAVDTIATIAGTSPDGLALDVCGNLYAVDQQGNMIYRLFLDDNGDPVGDAEALLDATTNQNIANAQFGSGEGWSEDVLYAVGVPGTLYEIPVGVPGKPYPTP